MSKQQLLNARFAFRDGPYHILFVELQSLSERQDSFSQLRLQLDKDDVRKSTFEIDSTEYFYNYSSAVACIANTERANIQ
jgi:hypothetical protein